MEFRGVVEEDGVYLVNLFNPATKTSQWLPVNGRAAGLEVRSFDASADKVEITQGGRPLTLTLKQAKVAFVQAAPVAAGPAEPNRPAEGLVAAGPRPNSVDPAAARNLPPEAQAMIQEFRRRRAERANQQGPQPQQRPRQLSQPQQQQP